MSVVCCQLYVVKAKKLIIKMIKRMINILTDESGTIWFTLHQGQQFKLSQDSQMEIDELSDQETEDDRITVRLVLGYLWSKIQKHAGKSKDLRIHTPTVIMGIRGTEFERFPGRWRGTQGPGLNGRLPADKTWGIAESIPCNPSTPWRIFAE